jgi:AcrR family transcriptional regulator
MELQNRIITAAINLFIKYGIRSVTMDQISRDLGISKRTLYENFKDKTELLRKSLDHLSSIKQDEAWELVRQSNNVIETIYLLARKGAEMKQLVNPLFFEDIRKYYPELHNMLISESRSRNYSLTRTLLMKGISDGLFKDDLNIEMVNHYLHQVMNMVMNEDIFPKDRYRHEEIFHNIIMPYLIGISTLRGQQQIHKYFEKEIKL